MPGRVQLRRTGSTGASNEYVVDVEKKANGPVGVTFEESRDAMLARVITFDEINPTSVLANQVALGDQLLEVNGAKAKSAKQAASMIYASSKLSIRVAKPAADKRRVSAMGSTSRSDQGEDSTAYGGGLTGERLVVEPPPAPPSVEKQASQE